MKSLITFFLMLFVLGVEGQNLKALYDESLKAYNNKDYQKFKELNTKALEINPSQPKVLYNLAVGNVLTGEIEEAAHFLNRLLTWNTQTNYLGDKDFKPLFADDYYMEMLRETKSKYNAPIVKSELYAKLPASAHIEDIVKSGSFLFFTDVHAGNILKYEINKKNTTVLANFPLSVMAVTEGILNRTIWASTAALPEYRQGNTSSSGVALYEIDIMSGEVLSTIKLPGNAIVGSMAKAENDILYASDSSRPQIFVIDTKLKKLIKTIRVNGAKNLQGIDLNFNGNKLFIADYIKGVCILDLEKEEVQTWFTSNKYLLKGIDGVQFMDRRNLLVIQNNSTPKRVVKIMHIDGRVQNVSLLDNKLPLKGEPTNGFYDPEEGFYYVANSQWPFYDKDRKPLYSNWETQQIRFIPMYDLVR